MIMLDVFNEIPLDKLLVVIHAARSVQQRFIIHVRCGACASSVSVHV